jgi:hypothetical protein
MTTFTVGNLVGRSFQLWWRNLGVFTALAALVTLPLIGAAFALGLGSLYVRSPLEPVDPGFFVEHLGRLSLFYVLIGAVFAIHMAALTHGAIQSIGERPVRLGELVAVGVRRALPVIAAALLVYVLVVLGFVLLVVPGVFFACALVVTVPAVVVERTGPLGGMRRSFRLTRGRRLAIFAAFFVFLVVLTGVSAVGNLVFPLVGAAMGPQAAMVGVLLSLGVNVVFASLYAIAPAVAYHDLRAEKESWGTADLVKIFE